jgi:ribosomal protein S3AE
MASKNISTKRKKKAWHGIYAPESLNNAFLGETHVYTNDEMIGKTISMNLSMITKDMKKQNVIMSFRVKEVKDNKGITELTGYALSLAYIKRLVRRKRDKIDDSFIAKCKEGKSIRIKTVIMTNSKTYESANSAIRLSLRAKIKKSLKEMSFEEFINALVNVRLQKDWKSSLSKIYPLKFLEVRYVALEDSKRALKDIEETDFTEKITSDEDAEIEEKETQDATDEDTDSNVQNEEIEDLEDTETQEIDEDTVDDDSERKTKSSK